MVDDKPLTLDSAVLDTLVRTKATCPFIGAVLATTLLPVRNTAADPLAALEDLRTLGNSGGGDLGDLLVLFASGNHGFMRGNAGSLNVAVPQGLFSLEFPGSQGSHPGHSGILQGDPGQPGSGRLGAPEYNRLLEYQRESRIARSDVGKFIAENLRRDPQARVVGWDVVRALALDVGALTLAAGSTLLAGIIGDDTAAAFRKLEMKLTKLLGEDNLFGSAGEFGLLFAFFAHQPDGVLIDDEPTIAVSDLEAMFVHKRLPLGWQAWPKRRIDWVWHTVKLAIGAMSAY